MAITRASSVSKSLKNRFDGFTWSLWYAITLFGAMGIARGKVYMISFVMAYSSSLSESGIEEALVGTMVEQRSFISDFGLDAVSNEERAGVTGNVVAMSQLGCIAGALTYGNLFS